MKRSFNYTGRERIKRSQISIHLSDNEGGPRTFGAEVDFAGLDLPREAAVFVEAHYRTSYMRFDFGSVENLRSPSDCRLVDFPKDGPVLFRVKVVGVNGEAGKILASAKGIRAEDHKRGPENRKSILWIEPCDLDHEIWRLHFEASMPILEVNNKISGITEIVKRDEMFRTLVHPVIVRRVLEEIVVLEEVISEGDLGGENDWRFMWMQFVKAFHPDELPQYENDYASRLAREEWINEAVQAFCKERRLRDVFAEHIQVE